MLKGTVEEPMLLTSNNDYIKVDETSGTISVKVTNVYEKKFSIRFTRSTGSDSFIESGIFTVQVVTPTCQLVEPFTTDQILNFTQGSSVNH